MSNLNLNWLTWPMVGKIFAVLGSLAVCAVALGMNIQVVKSDVRAVRENIEKVSLDLGSTDKKVSANSTRITRVEGQVESFEELHRDIKASVVGQREVLSDLKSITHELKGRVDAHRGGNRNARDNDGR